MNFDTCSCAQSCPTRGFSVTPRHAGSDASMTSQHKASLVHCSLQHVLHKTHFGSLTASQLKMRFREKGSYLIFPFEMFPCASKSASWFEERNCPKSSLHHNRSDVSDRPGLGWRELQALDQRSASWNFFWPPTFCLRTSEEVIQRKESLHCHVYRQVRTDRRAPTLSSYLRCFL